MKLHFREQPINYETYQFPYTVYAEMESGDTLTHLLESGFLPYSQNPSSQPELFYLARSLRYNLAEFTWNKKRRYEQRQFQQSTLEFKIVPRSENQIQEVSAYWEFANSAMKETLGETYLTEKRFHRIWQKPYVTHLAEIRQDEKLHAFAIINADQKVSHYWYAFYQSLPSEDLPLGKLLLGEYLLWAKESGQTHAYLGTCYGEKAAYKIKRAKGIEFWNGNSWVADKEALKAMLQKD